MSIVTLSAFLATVMTAAPVAAPQGETLRCAVALRSAADTMRASQGDSADARSLTMSASAAEENYRRQAATDGLNPLQIEIALAAEREARQANVEQLVAQCLGTRRRIRLSN